MAFADHMNLLVGQTSDQGFDLAAGPSDIEGNRLLLRLSLAFVLAFAAYPFDSAIMLVLHHSAFDQASASSVAFVARMGLLLVAFDLASVASVVPSLDAAPYVQAWDAVVFSFYLDRLLERL